MGPVSGLTAAQKGTFCGLVGGPPPKRGFTRPRWPITAVSDPGGISTLTPASAVTATGPEPYRLTRSSVRAACAVMLELIIVVLDSASACRYQPHADSWEACESG